MHAEKIIVPGSDQVLLELISFPVSYTLVEWVIHHYHAFRVTTITRSGASLQRTRPSRAGSRAVRSATWRAKETRYPFVSLALSFRGILPGNEGINRINDKRRQDCHNQPDDIFEAEEENGQQQPSHFGELSSSDKQNPKCIPLVVTERKAIEDGYRERHWESKRDRACCINKIGQFEIAREFKKRWALILSPWPFQPNNIHAVYQMQSSMIMCADPSKEAIHCKAHWPWCSTDSNSDHYRVELVSL